MYVYAPFDGIILIKPTNGFEFENVLQTKLEYCAIFEIE